MSKLFKLKEWLTVPDAARHLSIAFGEEVSEPDVLRLALDGHLKLSVNFVNHARAIQGKIVGYEDAEWRELPPEMTANIPNLPEEYKGKPIPCMTSLDIGNERYLNLDKEVTTIKGIWDLPMIGSERLDIEHQYQQLTGGPEVTLVTISGAFIEKPGGVMCQLQDGFDNNEYQLGSKAQLRELEELIEINEINGAEAQKLLDKYKEDRNAFLEKRKNRDEANNYYPADGLPEDAVIVVRTAALREFEQSINNEPANVNKPLTTIERDSLLKLVIGMAVQGYGYNPEAKKSGTVTEIKADIERLGISLDDDTIRNHLKQARTKLPAKPTNT